MAKAMAVDRTLYTRCKTEKKACLNACPPAEEDKATTDAINEMKKLMTKDLVDNVEAVLRDHHIKPSMANNGREL